METKLPSISVLLNQPCSPPSILLERPPTPPPPSLLLSAPISPVSRSSSVSPRPHTPCSAFDDDVDEVAWLPPIHGNDPPLPNKRSSFASTSAPWCASSSVFSPKHQQHQQQQPCSRPAAAAAPPSPSVISDHPPPTEIKTSSDGNPLLKRRRGRPPIMREAEQGKFTFLTPTVWDVKQSAEQAASNANQQQKSVLDGSVAAFSSSDMDTVLPVPQRKRGRKPKMHIAGNSCFVWKELAGTRRKRSNSQQCT